MVLWPCSSSNAAVASSWLVPCWMPCRGLVVVAALVVDMAVVRAMLVLLVWILFALCSFWSSPALRRLASRSVWTRRIVMQLVMLHLALFSFWSSTGPGCSASRSVWTRRTVMVAGFCWLRFYSRCALFVCRLARGAHHCGRYGQEGWLCSAEARTTILVVRVTCSVFQRNVCSTVDPLLASVSVDTKFASVYGYGGRALHPFLCGFSVPEVTRAHECVYALVSIV